MVSIKPTYFPKWRERLNHLKNMNEYDNRSGYIRDWGVAMADSERWNSCAVGEVAGFPATEWAALDATRNERRFPGMGLLSIDFVTAIYGTDADAAVAILDKMDRIQGEEPTVVKCGEHIGHFTNCEKEIEPLFTIDIEAHLPAKLVGFICPENHVRITRQGSHD